MDNKAENAEELRKGMQAKPDTAGESEEIACNLVKDLSRCKDRKKKEKEVSLRSIQKQMLEDDLKEMQEAHDAHEEMMKELQNCKSYHEMWD